MLRANDIVPQNSEPLEPQGHALNTFETSSVKEEYFEMKKEVESESEIYDEESLNMRENALLVRFRFHVENYRRFIIDFGRVRLRG